MSQKTRKGKKQAKDTITLSIPLEDLTSIICMGADIRISTMAMAKICDHKISMMMLDEKYQPAGILSAYESNVRQSLVMRKQVYMDETRKDHLWRTIIRKKISNQSAALHLLGLQGADEVAAYTAAIDETPEIDALEAAAAKTYFQYLCPDINRREESPMNSCLNYGYSIIRNTLIRSILSAGLLPAFGIHHQNQFNAFNLADDLIEPFRPCVDLTAWSMHPEDIHLSRENRKQLAQVLQHAVLFACKKMSVFSAVDQIVHNVRAFMIEEADSLQLPAVIPVEIIQTVRE